MVLIAFFKDIEVIVSSLKLEFNSVKNLPEFFTK
jgi:hypothetical protein